MGTAAPAKPGMQADLATMIAYQDELVRTQQYEYLGKAKIIVIEASRDANVPGVEETSVVGVRLDWRNDPDPKGGYIENFLPIAQSLDRKLLLALKPVVRRDGQVGLPDIPDPQWRRPNPDPTDPNPVLEEPRMIPQRLEERASGYVAGTKKYLFQPVHQIMFQPEINKALLPTYWSVEADFDKGTRTHMALLIDSITGAAHFYGGKFQINAVG